MLGRIDHQVKLRSDRASRRDGGGPRAARRRAVGRREGGRVVRRGEALLVAFAVPEGAARAVARDGAARAAREAPDYMVPAEIRFRPARAADHAERQDLTATHSPLRRLVRSASSPRDSRRCARRVADVVRLARVWAEVIGVPRAARLRHLLRPRRQLAPLSQSRRPDRTRDRLPHEPCRARPPDCPPDRDAPPRPARRCTSRLRPRRPRRVAKPDARGVVWFGCRR